MSESFTYSEWYRTGTMMFRRSALADSHPESIPSLWKKKFGEEMPFYARREAGLPDPHRCPTCRQSISFQHFEDENEL